MEMTTTYRYEREAPRAATLRKALSRQQARIREDEMLTCTMADVREGFNKTQIAVWNETSHSKMEHKIVKRQADTMAQELKTASSQLITMRRQALRGLLTKESEEHRGELEAMGLTYAICRL